MNHREVLLVYNSRNGLIYMREETYRSHIGYFLSTHAHQARYYFKAEAMPLAAIAHLLRGGVVGVVDASRRRVFPDALISGVGSWVYTFNRGLRIYEEDLVPYGTPAMQRYAKYSREAERVKKIVRRLQSIFGNSGPARAFLWHPDYTQWIYGGRKISVGFPEKGPAVVSMAIGKAYWDDNPEYIASMLTGLDRDDSVIKMLTAPPVHKSNEAILPSKNSAFLSICQTPLLPKFCITIGPSTSPRASPSISLPFEGLSGPSGPVEGRPRSVIPLNQVSAQSHWARLAQNIGRRISSNFPGFLVIHTENGGAFE